MPDYQVERVGEEKGRLVCLRVRVMVRYVWRGLCENAGERGRAWVCVCV